MPVATPTASSKTLSTQAFELLHADILAGALRPEERLRIQALSARYDIGPAAIREALSRLTTNGLVNLQDQRGFSVAPISSAELADLTRARVQIESLALRQAIERGGVEWESDILSAFHRLSKTTLPFDPDLRDDWDAMHVRFHEALIAGCGSPTIIDLCRLLYAKLERYRNLAGKHMTPTSRDVIGEHRALLEAAMDRDADRAQVLMDEHFGRTADIVQEAVFGNGGKPAKGRARKTAAATAR